MLLGRGLRFREERVSRQNRCFEKVFVFVVGSLKFLVSKTFSYLSYPKVLYLSEDNLAGTALRSAPLDDDATTKQRQRGQ